ncbi:hypothetical protein H2248_007445 [Termitomyces sp. 'cryptogamus']|nr:hypothetical protein H2248_007445 [Termitomyces sp. 'cryptogamus']
MPMPLPIAPVSSSFIAIFGFTITYSTSNAPCYAYNQLAIPQHYDLEPQLPDPPTQNNKAVLTGMMTMLCTFAALANQSLGLMSSFAADMPGLQTNPPLSFPAFVSTDQSPAGKSLPTLFPTIKTSMLLDIAHHKFCPMDLCKLDPVSKFRYADLDCTDSSNSRITGTKDYPALHNLLIPLSTYFSVLQAFATSSGNIYATFVIRHGTSKYMLHLITLNQKYGWSAVLQYYIHFHLNH